MGAELRPARLPGDRGDRPDPAAGGALGRPENQLPQEIKQNLANLANFIVKHTMTLEAALEKKPESVGVLININREIAAGLRTTQQAA